MKVYFLLIFVMALTLSSPQLIARIGEDRATIEKRLTSPGTKGIRLKDETLYAFYLSKVRLKDFIEIIEDELTIEIYYKSLADRRPVTSKLFNGKGRPIDNPNGWLLYVVYKKGRSALEIYRRSKSISDAELNGILALNKGNAHWVKGEEPPRTNSSSQEEDLESIIGYNFYRSDGNVRGLNNAKQRTVMLFDPKLDMYIAKVKYKLESEEAPSSLEGF